MPAPNDDEFIIELPDEGPAGTRLEDVEDLRRQLGAPGAGQFGGMAPVLPTVQPLPPAGRPGPTVREVAAPVPAPAPSPPPGQAGVVPFRPVHRPPMALL